MTPAERATAVQRAASDPSVSAFVAASAGSGKTKLLVDRLLRLMLDGADPGRILCLTFTRAGAAEMAVRLRGRLGEWVTLDDAALDARLHDLDTAPSAELRTRARALFAHVLDLPGGMRIDTIHGFCQALLRRFPLEASLSPRFRLMEERDAATTLAAAREQALDAATVSMPDAVGVMSSLLTAPDFASLINSLRAKQAALAPVLALSPSAREAAYRAALALDPAATDDATILARAVRFDDASVRAAALAVASRASPTCRANAAEMLDWLALDTSDRAANWAAWIACFLKKDGDPKAAKTLASKDVAEHASTLLAEADRICAVEDQRRALRLMTASLAMLALAEPILRRFTAAKAASGLLDYDDLIDRTDRLLDDPGAAWVHYKLDGGIDHLLLDEVQDTAPAQWHIAARLVDEFFAGAGADAAGHARPRTVFAVGDRKQSIFSFQGADPLGFDTWRQHFRARAADAQHGFVDQPLDVSFRSSAAILTLVDAVFADADAGRGVMLDGETLRHQVARETAAGRVELWPLAPKPDEAAVAAWTPADGNRAKITAPGLLAETLADWIRDELTDPDSGLTPGDIMVLVQTRTAFPRALVNALKARGVPVAGLDRMTLVEQPAVEDLLALCDALLLPEDDLAVACVLTSPLGGLTDDSLMDLAIDRGAATLFDTLHARADERPDWSEAWAMLKRLRARVDFVPAHALLTEALGPLGGRARLLGRLGAEAADPIDELLAAALEHEATHPPSLQHFLHWLRATETDIKREAEGAGGLVRVLTVHGAKGLEAKLVILPDTVSPHRNSEKLVWATLDGGLALPVLVSQKALLCRPAVALRDAQKIAAAEERNRLLYVALTRARDRLIVCGHTPARSIPDGCWYAIIEAAMDRLSAEHVAFPTFAGEMRRYRHDPPSLGAVKALPPAAQAAPPVPAWLGTAPDWRAAPPPVEPVLPTRLAPSRPDGVELGPVPHAASPIVTRDAEGPFRRGSLIHTLLQHLPTLPPPARRDAARRWLTAAAQGVKTDEAAVIADETMAVLENPDLAPLFGPGSRAEAPLTGIVRGAVVGGLVDRIAILPDRVLICDYKTGRDAPDRVEDTPVLYCRQMAAYRDVLRAIYPDRPVTCALVWTRAARITVLPDTILDASLMTGVGSTMSRP